MKIRAKVVALLAAVFAALTAVEWMVAQAVLLPRFDAIELDNAGTAMKRIDYGINQALSAIQVSAADWGNWKDTYQFIVDHDPRFAQENLSEAAMTQLHLTAIAFIDLDGRVVLGRGFDIESESFQPLDLFPQGALPEDFIWRRNLLDGNAGRGLIATRRGVLLAAVAPILDGFGQGPSRGMVLMGRLLTDAELAGIGARAQTSVAFADLHAVTGDAQETVRIRGDTTEVLRRFDDVYGQPAMTLQVDVPRTITAGARTTVNYVLALTLGAAVIVLLILLIALDRTVLAPLARVTRHAVAIGSGDDLTTRLNLRRNDEFGTLAAEFDRMVGQVAQSRRQLVDSSFQAGMAELSRGVLHNIGNAITPLRVRLVRLQERLRAAPIGDVTRALAARAVAADPSPRQADLDEFLRLASGEMAGIIDAAGDDLAVIARQSDVIQGALTEQSRTTRTASVIEAATLPAIVEQTLEIVPDRCRELVRIEVDPSLAAVGTVQVARTLLRMVLQNLIINAAEAVRATGHERGVVRLSAALIDEAGSPRLRLSCVDDGVGIAAGDLERVFERGYSTKLEHGNLGIGLHWCATTVNAMGGRIWADSEGPGRGAAFHLVLPMPEPAASAGARAA